MKTAKKPANNVQAVKNLMEFSEFGPLSQAFVMDALAKHAKRVSESKPEDYPENCFVRPESWIGVAKEINDKLKSWGY
jgi:hypothetical protein